MADEKCLNCGKDFLSKQGGYRRSSLHANIPGNVGVKIAEVIEEQYGVKMTPECKEKRFVCESCVRTLGKLAKASSERRSFGQQSSYLKRKSIISTPRHIRHTPTSTPSKKRQKLVSPLWDKTTTDGASTSKYVTVQMKKTKVHHTENRCGQAIRYLRACQYQKAILSLEKSVGFRKSLKQHIEKRVRQETRKYISLKNSHLKGGKNLDDFESFDWGEVIAELEATCPTLMRAIIGSVTSEASKRLGALGKDHSTSMMPAAGTVAAILLFMRRRTMSCLQEMNSLQLWLSGTKRELFARFNHLGLCLGIDGTRSAVDLIRNSYNREVLQWKTECSEFLFEQSDRSQATLPYTESSDQTDADSDILSLSSMSLSPRRQTPPLLRLPDTDGSVSSECKPAGAFAYSICFDNVNTKVTVRHQTKDRKNKMFNMVQAYAARDRVATLHLSDRQPLPEELAQIPLSVYFPTLMDEMTLRSEMTLMVSRILVEYLPSFQPLAQNICKHLLHKYSTESSKKSIMVPLGVLDKDESKTADMIEIMEDYQQYVPMKSNGAPLVLPLHADGLSCERGNDAQNARINGVTPWLQLQALTLNAQEWHKRCTLLQDVYDELYKPSGRDKGTMFHLKNYFQHRNVTTNVKQSFNFNEEFLEFCGEAYVVLAAVHLLGLSDLHNTPQDYPDSEEDRLHLLNTISSQIIDMVFLSSMPTVRKVLDENDPDEDTVYCICQQEDSGPMIFCTSSSCSTIWYHLECLDMSEDDVPDAWVCDTCKAAVSKKKEKKKKKTVASSLEDSKRNYTMRLMWRSLNQMVRRDSIRENDGERILLHWKLDMLQFFEKHHPKYFLLGQRLLSAVGGGASPRLRHTLTWNRTVNPTGGQGKNIAMDLQMEFYNKEYKESVKDAGGNLTEATIARHSQMVGVGKVLRQNYEKKVSGLCRRQTQKTGLVSREKDIAEFVTMMVGEDLFTPHPGRAHAAFPDMDHVLYKDLQPNRVSGRLERHTKQMAKRRTIINLMQEQ